MLYAVSVKTGSDIGVTVEFTNVYVSAKHISDQNTCEYVYMTESMYNEFTRKHIEAFGGVAGTFTYSYNFGTAIPKLDGYMNSPDVFNNEYVAVINGTVYVAVPADWHIVKSDNVAVFPDYTIIDDSIVVDTEMSRIWTAVYIEGYGQPIVSWNHTEVAEEDHIFARIAQLISIGYESGCEALAAEIGMKWSVEKEQWVVDKTRG